MKNEEQKLIKLRNSALNICLVISRFFHIHRWKLIGLYYEQPSKEIFLDAERYTECDRLYVDYRIEKCRCGKISNPISSIYTADKVMKPISSSLKGLQLINKDDVIRRVMREKYCL